MSRPRRKPPSTLKSKFLVTGTANWTSVQNWLSVRSTCPKAVTTDKHEKSSNVRSLFFRVISVFLWFQYCKGSYPHHHAFSDLQPRRACFRFRTRRDD